MLTYFVVPRSCELLHLIVMTSNLENIYIKLVTGLLVIGFWKELKYKFLGLFDYPSAK